MARTLSANVGTIELERKAGTAEPWWRTIGVTDRRPEGSPADAARRPRVASTSALRRVAAHADRGEMRDTLILVGMILAQFAAVVGAFV